ncbi:Fpg/Nei family DNA glycosylase [Paenarthrobacter ilicis]|uniref:Formamidopyrimidine-DNA glycosylase n=1 Tax=Paenarthrobacter ilicis TaxID=43665 RepID=A0ABX0TI15_9MICC|nr:Fpg/Nei family DNA glycosylase [Paenarthrobacter ilicis]MBM7793475.1 formamidopyrimidine-DNA glycosylase [Paenarthrobacter ilicis]NIJ01749.1 formamidopyrimidine-DNA glycosylase [Paenarthrobacter ilicis]
MPELPEVHGLCMYLDTQLRGATVTQLKINSFSALKTADPPYSALEGHIVQGVQRFGKFICIDLDGLSLVFHLAKAGWVRYTEHPSSAGLRMGKSNISARILLHRASDDAHIGIDLTEAGTKKSLAIYVVRDPQEVPGLASLGPEPLSPDFDVESLASILSSSSMQIKGLLRNQGVIAGIGNAYSDEILHAAKLSPFASAKSLDRQTVELLYQAMQEVLVGAVNAAAGKPSNELKDTKRSNFRVHARTGQPCPVCGDTVREVSFADTSLQYCATCQTGGKILADRRTSRFLK